MKSRTQLRSQNLPGTGANRRRTALLTIPALSLIGLAGCHNDMWVQPKIKPQYQSDFFADEQANRPLVPHSVARSQFWTDSERYTGYGNDNKIATTFPFKMTRQDVERGKERFGIYCTPCHGALGNGQGMIAMRGFALRRQPGNYHTEKLRNAPVGHFYDVITNGFGTMYSYASRVEPDDRWRIVAYIKVLQRSQAATLADVDQTKLSPAERKQIETPPPVNAQNPNGTGTNGAPLPATTQPPLADTPVPNTPTPNGTMPAQATPGTPSAPAPNVPGAPTNAAPPSGTGSGTRTSHDQPPVNTQGGTSGSARVPATNGTTPPAGGVNGPSNR